MVSYRLSCEPGICWNLFTEEAADLSDNNGHAISRVLSQVRQVFVNTFGQETVNSHPLLAVLPSRDGPVTYRKHAIIFLSATGAYYNQFIYQFSHELCHFMIDSEVCAPFRWFEETLCEAMSWYVLDQVYLMRDSSPLSEMECLYPTIKSYIENSMEKRIKLKGCPLSIFIKNNQPYLQHEPYDRNANAAVAYALFPLLQRHPELWKIVPYMNKLNADMDLRSALDTLFLHAQLHGATTDEFIQALFQ